MSTLSHDDIKHLLLDMISTTCAVKTQRIASLDSEDWQILRSIAAQQRIGPMLHRKLEQHGNAWPVPLNVAQIWAASYRKSAMRSLQFQLTLHTLDTILKTAAIRYGALKGAWLFLHAYEQPALRPMRDVDIIVDHENALQAYALLEQHGFKRLAEFAKPSEYSFDHTKHLPPLRCTKTGTLLEVHTRLVEQISDAQKHGTIGDTSALLDRTNRRDGISFLNPTDTMLHLVLHAVYDHRFNNGPLTLNDVALLAYSSEIDWDRFWAMAETGNWTQGAELLFAMVRRYHDPTLLPERPSATAPSLQDVDSALLLTLQDFDHRQVVAFRTELALAHSLRQRLAVFWKRAFPARHLQAAATGSRSAAWWMIAYYPRWLFERLARVTGMLFENHTGDVDADIRRAAQVETWLQANRKSSA